MLPEGPAAASSPSSQPPALPGLLSQLHEALTPWRNSDCPYSPGICAPQHSPPRQPGAQTNFPFLQPAQVPQEKQPEASLFPADILPMAPISLQNRAAPLYPAASTAGRMLGPQLALPQLLPLLRT